MKNSIILALLSLLILTSGCKTQQKTVYVPVETVKTEFRDNFVRDSIYINDSIVIRERGDTVFFEKYKYLYRDKIVTDSVFINHIEQVPYPVEVVKEVNYITGWQNFQIWIARIALGMGLSWLIVWLIRKKLKL
ncbi:MAG: hypothetical protein LBO74_16915 [Candidatus Symbiothrix sp.]|jgi:hypothetical protein|nr:hypothetical protein [Candidatus Symbiothrix sp.]